MNQSLVDNWNKIIGKHDEVYHLGDFAFASTKTVQHIVKSLNGRIHLIKGNHDYKQPRHIFDLFESVENLRQISFDKQKIVLCHFPILSWNGKHHGVWHLHGHSHGGLSFDSNLKRLDVGVDCHNYRPIHLDEIRHIFDNPNDFNYKLAYDPNGHNGEI